MAFPIYVDCRVLRGEVKEIELEVFIGDEYPHKPPNVRVRAEWALGPTVVLLKCATRRPRPGGMRPKSKLSVVPAVFLKVGTPMEAAPPPGHANGPQMHANGCGSNNIYISRVLAWGWG